MKPLICIPMGDPAGIGPEIIIKSLCRNNFSTVCNIVVVGDRNVMIQAADICREQICFIPYEKNPSSNIHSNNTIHLFDSPIENPGSIISGHVSAAAGKASVQFLKQAVALVHQQPFSVLTTPPINKKSLNAAHIKHIGHTEILADLTGTSDPITLFQVKNLRVFFLTRHMSLKMACEAITENMVYAGIMRSIRVLNMLGIAQPHIAVAGLNPHCGESGLFGDEEVRFIRPAIEIAQQKGINVTGPCPADSVFHQALCGQYDGVLSLYHDQGHIATKMVDFEKTIAITCGLPFLRTSVDHGTAYDIAGTGKASEISMTEAILLAARYAHRFSTLPTEEPTVVARP